MASHLLGQAVVDVVERIGPRVFSVTESSFRSRTREQGSKTTFSRIVPKRRVQA